MLNFKKGSIFSRSAGNEDDYEEYKQEDQGGVLAVWGSPGSGKTTVAARIAKHLAGKRKNTILLLCDMSAPMLPCICPPRDLENKGSLGSVLAAAHVSDSLIKNMCTIRHRRITSCWLALWTSICRYSRARRKPRRISLRCADR